MELKGICSICQRSDTMYTCQFCGRIVCSNCFDSLKGVCIQCCRGRSLGSVDSMLNY